MMTMTGRARWYWRVAVVLMLSALVYASLVQGPWRLAAGTITGSSGGAGALPCPRGRDVSIMASPHVGQSEIDAVTYTSIPPTSGPHLAFPAAPGIYTEPVPDGLTVHALEHGRVAIQYGAAAMNLADLERIARSYAGDTMLAPHPRLASGEIALTAWGCIDLLPAFDEGRIVAFVEELSGRYHHGWRS